MFVGALSYIGFRTEISDKIEAFEENGLSWAFYIGSIQYRAHVEPIMPKVTAFIQYSSALALAANQHTFSGPKQQSLQEPKIVQPAYL
ncbi:hypothetical protein DFP97_107133 [Paenibacillus prosopidis]|uniref:Uncharacterized protein n=1 Tax=Paenibacillus prosopidis TaxID=630520 RepID=A0A368VZS6_9BACL|nr:hypothetical protein DFP97_107133 [Paenibacillus prosopidis]